MAEKEYHDVNVYILIEGIRCCGDSIYRYYHVTLYTPLIIYDFEDYQATEEEQKTINFYNWIHSKLNGEGFDIDDIAASIVGYEESFSEGPCDFHLKYMVC